MGFIERRSGEGRYRARYRDPLGRQRSKTFGRKADAQRFLLEMESDKARGGWIDPRGAELPLAAWAEEFMLLCRRLAPTTQDTYRRDLDRYVLPRFGSYRLGRIPADEIENWLDDEIAAGLAPSSVHRHYRLLRRMLQVAVDKQKVMANPCAPFVSAETKDRITDLVRTSCRSAHPQVAAKRLTDDLGRGRGLRSRSVIEGPAKLRVEPDRQ
jgi:hypothetical protein